MDHPPNSSEMKQESLPDNDDAWIKDYLIPKLINDGKIFNRSEQVVGITSENINVNDNNNNTSPCHANISRVSSNDKTRKNQIQVVSVNVKPVSIDGFMLSAPCKVEIEYSYESGSVVFDKVYLVVKVGV